MVLVLQFVHVIYCIVHKEWSISLVESGKPSFLQLCSAKHLWPGTLVWIGLCSRCLVPRQKASRRLPFHMTSAVRGQSISGNASRTSMVTSINFQMIFESLSSYQSFTLKHTAKTANVPSISITRLEPCGLVARASKPDGLTLIRQL